LGAVRVERVTFTSAGQRMVGNLYLPADLPAGGRVPAAVVGGAWMTVKEQMAGRYARELAARGIAALAFDYRGWGESAGAADGSVAEVRQREVPTHKIADLRAAVDFLARHPAVDPARLAGVGICASANYMAAVLADEPRLTAAVFVAPWLQDPEVAAQVYGGADGMATLTALATETAAREQAAGRQEFVPAASLTDRTAVMFGAPYYTESDRGLIPAWRNQVDVAFWPGWLTVDGISAAARMRQPTLVVHSEAAGVPQGAHRFYTRLAGEKHELWLRALGSSISTTARGRCARRATRRPRTSAACSARRSAPPPAESRAGRVRTARLPEARGGGRRPFRRLQGRVRVRPSPRNKGACRWRSPQICPRARAPQRRRRQTCPPAVRS
jgi:dienelactone hydrolase